MELLCESIPSTFRATPVRHCKQSAIQLLCAPTHSSTGDFTFHFTIEDIHQPSPRPPTQSPISGAHALLLPLRPDDIVSGSRDMTRTALTNKSSSRIDVSRKLVAPKYPNDNSRMIRPLNTASGIAYPINLTPADPGRCASGLPSNDTRGIRRQRRGIYEKVVLASRRLACRE